MTVSAGPRTDYDAYLRIPELLALQHPMTEGAHDEMLFVIIHQVFELWFKLILHELDAAHHALSEGFLAQAVPHLRRIVDIFELLIQQLRILETMSPEGFLAFRDPLAPASGFESFQFREIEAVLGVRSSANIPITVEHREVVRSRLTQPDLYEALWSGLVHSAEVAKGPDRKSREGRIEIIAGIYREHKHIRRAVAHQLCELLVDIDEAFGRWRYRHIQMAARQIGRRSGTGGTGGVTYLESTLSRRCFPELWEIRSQL